jgi:alanyl-tRNA synthetase
MQFKTMNQLRDLFLDFFEARGHYRLPSFPLVPQNDKSLLLINAGMAPLKPYFTGIEAPPAKRVVTCQKCIRTIDIDEVGKKARYCSFFEMLGNFSFGDYFKKEAIHWAWAFLTQAIGMDKDRLLISVYQDDDEAYDIWKNEVGIPPERVYRMGKKDNFWEHGVGGPCGPCSEIHFDRGAEYACRPDCRLGCDCDRYLEVWNLVFPQFVQNESGGYDPLVPVGIDTGMGLERLALVVQGVDSVFDIDTMRFIRERVLSFVKGRHDDVSVNIIADHAKSVTFMAADGVLPSNEGRGYVLRRLLRRAVRHGKTSGISQPFVGEVARQVIDAYSHAYPELSQKKEHILQVLTLEESRFLETLDSGLVRLQKEMDAMQGDTLCGAEAFKLYDTFGFPLELMREILEEKGLHIDEPGFHAEMQAQKQRARAARGESDYLGADETVYAKLPKDMVTSFCGYDILKRVTKTTVVALVADGEIVPQISQGQDAAIFLRQTPFYTESGGQKGDSGTITAKNGFEAAIKNCVKVTGGYMAHLGEVQAGQLGVGDAVTVSYDPFIRKSITCHHSATHLLQKALREVLGEHVEQAGSEVGSERLRFDFTHFSAMTPDEKDKTERIINEKIIEGLSVTVTEATPEEARKMGAMALFGEKYGDKVRVVNIGGYSIELCGGTHVANTQDIGLFKLVSESSVASGVRRIEGVCSFSAVQVYREAYAQLTAAAAAGKTTPDQLAARVEALLQENKQLKKDMAKGRAAGLAPDIDALVKQAVSHKGFNLLAVKADGLEIEALRDLADRLKAKIKSGALLLCGLHEGAAQFIASATDDAVKAGIHAGNIAKQAASLCGGGGGGRPNHAQAGGKDASKADEALAAALALMKEQLG